MSSINNIKKALKEDLWKIIEENITPIRDDTSFLEAIFYIFLEKQEFTMKEVQDLARKFKERYYKILENSKNIALTGDILKAMKEIDINSEQIRELVVDNFNADRSSY